MSCSASDFEEGELVSGVKAGDKLKVKESRIVYHSPKHKVSPHKDFGLALEKHFTDIDTDTTCTITHLPPTQSKTTIYAHNNVGMDSFD